MRGKTTWVAITVTLLVVFLTGCQALQPQMSYQGQLTDPSGNPVPDANYQMTFRLYSGAADPVGSEVWSETQTVAVSGGLFNVELGTVEPMGTSLFTGQLWLGVEVASDGEMTPRQKLAGAPYAMSLAPGAIVAGTMDQGTLPGAVLVVANDGTASGLGVIATGENGIVVAGLGTGRYGVSMGDFEYGVRIERVDNGGIITATTGTGLKVSVTEPDAQNAIYASGAGDGEWVVFADGGDSNGGVIGYVTGGTGNCGSRGSSAAGVGGYFWNDNGTYYALRAYNATGAAAPGLHVRGASIFTGAKTGYVAELCQNAGPEVLEPGDVVAIVGHSAAVLGEIPVVQVRRADAASATAVIGIVDARQVVTPAQEDLINDPQATTSPEAEVRFAEGAIQPGDYLLVVTLGAYKGIKVDASGSPIRPGDLLTASPNGGYAMKATPLDVNGVTFYAPGTIIGKALGSLESGKGLVPVFVTVK